jgi:hypothetical protein
VNLEVKALDVGSYPRLAMLSRRTFTRTLGHAGFAASLGRIAFVSRWSSVSAAETRLPAHLVQFRPEIEPLVRLLEDTARERVIEEVASRIRKGLTYRDVVSALFLAGIRNIQPRPIGFKFHAVLVVHAAHLAAQAASDSDRWLPILWAVDQFKSSQGRDIQEGDWAMAAVDESAVPPAHRARQAFRDAMESWDETAADTAITGLARTVGAHEIFEILCRYGIRDFRELGHKLIYIVNAFRALEVIGWQHAEPVLRGIVYALLDRVGDANPSKSDLPADRPFRRNEVLIREIREGWVQGLVDSELPRRLMSAAREGSAVDTSRLVVEQLNRGVGPASILDGLHLAASDLLVREPGILSLHAHTFTNAVHYAWQHVRSDELRRLLLAQNAAFLPLFRGEPKKKRLTLESLEPQMPSAKDIPGALEETFADVGPNTALAASKLLSWLKEHPDPQPFADMARRLIFLKGRDAHDYKFSSAVLEDIPQIDERWRGRFVAASLFNLRGSAEKDTDLVKRIRDAMG